MFEKCFIDEKVMDIHEPDLSALRARGAGVSTLMKPTNVKPFIKWFNSNCHHKNNCTIPYSKLDVTSECQRVLDERVYKSAYLKDAARKSGLQRKFPGGHSYLAGAQYQPNVVVVAECRLDDVDVSAGFHGKYVSRKVSKGQFAVFVVGLDLVIVVILIIFIWRLDG